MKVMQVLPALDGGGVERGTLEIAQYLTQQGHESVVLSAGGSLVEQLEREGSRHLTLDIGRKSPLTFALLWRVRALIRAEKPDILHLRSRMPAWVCRLAWKGLKPEERPHLITTVHGLYSVGRYSSIMCRGERVIAVSETVRSYIEQNYPLTDMGRVRVIFRGIDPEAFKRGYRPSHTWLESWGKQYPQLRGQKVLTLPGRLTRLKGHHDFIDLIRDLRAQGQEVHGLIVGGEDPKRRAYAKELRDRVSSEGLESAITFTGSRSDIRDIYAVSDLVLSLSNKPESFGRTVAEALSLGTAVVGYAHGGVREILERVFPAGAVPCGDTARLNTVVDQLLTDPQSPGEMPFLQQNMLKQTLSCYNECLE